jgi:hypothetical protein
VEDRGLIGATGTSDSQVLAILRQPANQFVVEIVFDSDLHDSYSETAVQLQIERFENFE